LPLPTVLFIDSQGNELLGLRAIGFRGVEDFVGRMKEVS
jgi:hypothetical protein